MTKIVDGICKVTGTILGMCVFGIVAIVEIGLMLACFLGVIVVITWLATTVDNIIMFHQ